MDSPLTEFARSLATTDTKKKLGVGQDIIDFLGDPSNQVECEDFGSFVDGLVPWMQSSNFKVSQNGLDIVGLLIERLGSSFRPYLNVVLAAVIDRLGDARETVREKANAVLVKVMDEVVEPQQLFDKLANSFSHKNGKVREELLLLTRFTLNTYGAQSLTVSRLLPSIVDLLSDPTAPVRDVAFSTIVEIYKHVGERCRLDLQKKYQVPPAKLSQLMSRFDEIRSSGELMPSALTSGASEGSRRDGGEDETDRMSAKSSSSAKSRSSSVPAGARRAPATFTMPKPPPTADGRASVGSSIRRNPSLRIGSSTSASSSASAASAAGAVDEDAFTQAFEEVKRVSIYSGRALADELQKIRETLSKSSNDWKVRIDSMQMLRALMIAGAINYEEMQNALRTLDVPFQVSVKDLRSQVVREACITIAYISQEFSHRADRFLESLLQAIINQIPNSAKVMSTSGIVCMRFVIAHTHSPRFIPIITSNMTSKSREIRRHCCEFLDQLLKTWPTHLLERHVAVLQEAIKKGVSDADLEARQFARKAYWGFADHFKDQADQLLSSLDATYRRQLQTGGMSNSSSNNSLHKAGRTFGSASAAATATMPRSRQASVTSSQENLSERRPSSTARKSSNSGIPMFSSPYKNDFRSLSRSISGASLGDALANTPGLGPGNRQMPAARSKSGLDWKYSRPAEKRTVAPNGNGTANSYSRSPLMTNGATPPSPAPRSNSAIDPSAVRRANVRAQYAQRSRILAQTNSPAIGIGIGASLPRPVRKSSADKSGLPMTPDSARGRRGIGVVQSNPGSRSTSPTSLRAYQTYYDTPGTLGRRRSSGIPRSTASSREQSPSGRSGVGGSVTPTPGSGLRLSGRMGPTSGRSVGGGALDRPPKRPLLTENILRQSREAEGALQDDLATEYNEYGYPDYGGGRYQYADPSSYYKQPPARRQTSNAFEDGSDESEASSIGSAGGAGLGGLGGPTPMKPRYLQSPNSARPRQTRAPLGLYRDAHNDSENLNPEEVQSSLLKTLNDIQNYSFDSPNGRGLNRSMGESMLVPSSPQTPQTPGANKFKLDKTPTLEEKISLLDIRDRSPGAKNGDAHVFSVQRKNIENAAKDDDLAAAISDIMKTLETVKNQTNTAERRTSMTQLIRMIRDGKTTVIKENFRAILRLLLENLSDHVGATRALVFGVLTEMLKQDQLIANFQAFTELIILKVLEAHRDEEKDVERAAEGCAAAMAHVLPPDTVIRVLNPIIKTGDYPVNQAGIKMLTRVADNGGSREFFLSHLPEIMPVLLKAYDNVESSVRKAAVFCMVSLHQLVGDELQPHLETLNGSKLKLLNLYIKRAQAQKEQSAPVSPRLLATPL